MSKVAIGALLRSGGVEGRLYAFSEESVSEDSDRGAEFRHARKAACTTITGVACCMLL